MADPTLQPPAPLVTTGGWEVPSMTELRVMDDLRAPRYGWTMSETLRFTIHYSDGGDGWIMAQQMFDNWGGPE